MNGTTGTIIFDKIELSRTEKFSLENGKIKVNKKIDFCNIIFNVWALLLAGNRVWFTIYKNNEPINSVISSEKDDYYSNSFSFLFADLEVNDEISVKYENSKENLSFNSGSNFKKITNLSVVEL